MYSANTAKGKQHQDQKVIPCVTKLRHNEFLESTFLPTEKANRRTTLATYPKKMFTDSEMR